MVSVLKNHWIPACAGMTCEFVRQVLAEKNNTGFPPARE
jgi:hypothetical protein